MAQHQRTHPTELAAAIRRITDAAERERWAVDDWINAKGTRGKPGPLLPPEATLRRRELVQAHLALGKLFNKKPGAPDGCSDRFRGAFDLYQDWHADNTPLPQKFDYDDLRFVSTAVRVMGEEAGRVEADLPDEALANLGTPLTDTQQAALDLILEHSPDGIMGKQLATALGIEHSTLTRHIIPELKKLHGVKNRSGAGYYLPV